MTRRGFSMVELVVAVAVLAVALVSLMTFSAQEVDSIEFTGDRLVATQALRELSECFGGLPLHYYKEKGFPERFEAWTPLHETLFADHPVMAGGPPGDPVGAEIEAVRAAIGLRRAVLVRGFTTAAGVEAGVVRFVVRYQGAGGQTRELTSAAVAY